MLREKQGTLEKTMKAEDNHERKSRGLKLNVISGKTSGMTREGSKTISNISVAGHQMVHLDIYADYLR